jgi:ribosome-interacting GTPase 1
MQEFLKGKFLKELIKGIASMRTFIYPSVLQSAALPVLKKSDQKNVIIRYSEMSGIKLTLLLPIFN